VMESASTISVSWDANPCTLASIYWDSRWMSCPYVQGIPEGLHDASKSYPRQGLWGSEMLRIPHCIDNQLRDGGKLVSPTKPAVLYSPETLFLFSWSQGLVRPEWINWNKLIHLIGSQTHNLLACSIVP
jgi:hypothetical protein